MRWNYPACQKLVLKYEGGYSNHPNDPGGVTLEGVIQKRYDEYRRARGLPQKRLTPQMRYTPDWIRERDEIYRKYYWDVVKADDLHAGVDLAVYDYAVNSGPGRAIPHFKPWAATAWAEPIKAIKGLCARRLSFLRGLRTWVYFGKGWGPRVASVEANGVRMALEQQKRPKEEIKKTLELEASAASKKQTQNTTGAVGTAGTGGAATVDSTVSAEPILQMDWLSLGLGVLVTGLFVFCCYRALVHLRRKQAYVAAAEGTA
jgi:lysozyme family protein